MKAIGTLVIALCAAVGPVMAEIPPWAGYWAFDPAWCENAARVGSVTPAPIYLADTEMLGYENSCDIIFAEPVGPDRAWVLNMSCTGEGSSYEMEQLILLSPDNNRLSIWDGVEIVPLQRCP